MGSLNNWEAQTRNKPSCLSRFAFIKPNTHGFTNAFAEELKLLRLLP